MTAVHTDLSVAEGAYELSVGESRTSLGTLRVIFVVLRDVSMPLRQLDGKSVLWVSRNRLNSGRLLP